MLNWNVLHTVGIYHGTGAQLWFLFCFHAKNML